MFDQLVKIRSSQRYSKEAAFKAHRWRGPRCTCSTPQTQRHVARHGNRSFNAAVLFKGLFKGPIFVSRGGQGWYTATVWLLILMLAAGCGYRMSGGGELPAGIKSLSVKTLSNRTAETGIEAIVSNALVRELNRLKPGVLTDSAGDAAVLGGSIGGLDSDRVAHVGKGQLQERSVVIRLAMDLTAADGTPVWKNRLITVEETYLTSADRQDTDSDRRQAIVKAAQRAAENVARQLMEDF